MTLFFLMQCVFNYADQIDGQVQWCNQSSSLQRSYPSVIVNKLTLSLLVQDVDEQEMMASPNIFCHFASGIGDPKYLPVPSWSDLSKLLLEALDSYNEINAVMSLVLFEDAMQHV